MKRVLVQIDGSNFYNRTKKIAPRIHLTTFDYAGLVKEITRRKRVQIAYYVGEVKKFPRIPKSIKLYTNQQRLFSHLRKQNITIKRGYLMRTKQSFLEKGVDVQIAVDIVRGALKNEYHTCYLISSDSDLLPAIKTALDEEKKIIYVGFQGALSNALTNNCTRTVILNRTLLKEFAKTP